MHWLIVIFTLLCSSSAVVAQTKTPLPPPPKDVSGPPLDADQSITGLASKVIKAGSGTAYPESASTVTVHYTGWTTDGRVFDSSYSRGQPATFKLDQVIRGWTEGLQLMVEGERRRLWIPERLAYQGRPGAPQGMLVFDVELLKIQRAPVKPLAPKDVASIPKTAVTTASGLATRVIRKGTGKASPKSSSLVTVHYTGWTTDGRSFDSSHTRGKPATFRLDQVIAGWTEALQLMVVGEVRRLWIPESLAYGGRAGYPKGMLVFDVELLEVK